MSNHAIEHVIQHAQDMGVIIPKSAQLSSLPDHTREQLIQELSAKLSGDRFEDSLTSFLQELGLTGWLATPCLQSIRAGIGSLLQSQAKYLRLRDVNQEVLLSMLPQVQASRSSSVQDGENGKEVTTPSRAETVATSGDAALQPGTHGTGESI